MSRFRRPLRWGARGDGVHLDGQEVVLGQAETETDFVGTAARYLRERAEQAPQTVREVFPPRLCRP